jgi:hypothetical protein
MTLDQILETYKRDCDIDRTELGTESLKIPVLHNKYFKLFSEERLRLKQQKIKRSTLYKQKYEYYMGILSHEELVANGWEPQPMKILKQDMPIYLDADLDMQTIDAKIAMTEEKISALDNIIRSLRDRGFQIKAAIEWEKFKSGI